MPRLDVVPDEITPGVFIGSKESAYNRDTLARLGISRIVVCCNALLEYHAADDTLRYHRLPMADSLDQHLLSYLDSALAFIAQVRTGDHRTTCVRRLCPRDRGGVPCVSKCAVFRWTCVHETVQHVRAGGVSAWAVLHDRHALTMSRTAVHWWLSFGRVW